jgi:hypothetical protein
VSRQIGQIKKQAFLASYAETGIISQSAKLCFIARSQIYEWLKDDPQFAEGMTEAEEKAVDRLEQEARRRAVEGVRKPVYQGGKKVGFVQEYSDTLLIFLLKGAKPEKYRERLSHEITGKDGGPVEVRQLTDEELDQRIKDMQR